MLIVRSMNTQTFNKEFLRTRAERIVILEEFVRKTSIYYQQISTGIMEIAPKIGKGIPLTDKLFDFKNAVIQLVDLNSQDTILSLTEFKVDKTSLEIKKQFMLAIKNSHDATVEIISFNIYGLYTTSFVLIKDACSKLIETINQFSDIVNKKYDTSKLQLKQTDLKSNS